MKRSFMFYCIVFLLSSYTGFAQKAKLGPISENADGELLVTDPVNNVNHIYYKSMSFTIKAGSGVVFYMQAAAFTPRIFMTDKTGLQIGTYQNPEKGKGQEATVALNAFRSDYPKFSPADTVITVFFTSVEEKATGKFKYGYIMLDSSQMVYDEKGPMCNRLVYLINHWQAGWNVIPSFKNQRQSHGNFYATDYCLMMNNADNGKGYFRAYLADKTHSYEETILKSTTNNGTTTYDKLVADVKQCLEDKDWTFTTAVKEDKEMKTKYLISNFQIKGAVKDQPQTILTIKRVVPDNVSEFNQYKVLLQCN